MHRKKSLRPREVYGITGSKGHGKDTFARLVQEECAKQAESRRGTAKTTFEVGHFAGALKRMSARIFGLTEDQMHDPARKEEPLKAPLHLDLFVGAMQNETGLPIRPAGKVATTPREVMQFFGTEYVRRAQDDYWVQRLLGDTASQRRVLVPDTRFPNEAEALRSVGGRIIKVVRIDAPASTDGHASEKEMASIEPDLLLGVRTGDLSLPRRVAVLIAQGKFDAATRYDYRTGQRAIQAYLSGTSAEGSALLLGQKHKDPYALYNLLDYYGIPARRQASNRVAHRTVEGGAEKRCGGACQQWLPLTRFNANSKAWDGVASLCRSCAGEANKARYEKYQKNDSLGAIFKTFQRSAAPRGWAFELTHADLEELWEKQGGLCAYTGRPMSFNVNDPSKMSLDRIDSTRGYTRENVVLCTTRVNLMKRDMSLGDFKLVVADLYRNLLRG